MTVHEFFTNTRMGWRGLFVHSWLYSWMGFERILAAKRANTLTSTRPPREGQRDLRQADTSSWEREIDEMVYQLYGLMEEEIKIVEGVKQ